MVTASRAALQQLPQRRDFGRVRGRVVGEPAVVVLFLPPSSSGNRTADLAGREAALAAYPDSFFTIPHFDGYRAVLIRLPQVTGAALREAITDGWLACAPPRLARDFPAG